MESDLPYHYIKQEVIEEEEIPVIMWMDFNDCLLDSSQVKIKQEVDDDNITSSHLDSLPQSTGEMVSADFVKIKSEEDNYIKKEEKLVTSHDVVLDLVPKCKQEVLMVANNFTSTPDEDLQIKDKIDEYENEAVFFCEYWKDTQNPFIDDGPDWRENVEEETEDNVDDVGLYFCNDCHFSTTSKAILQEHVFQHLERNKIIRRNLPVLDIKEKMLFCEFCDFKTIHHVSMKLHRSMHRNKGKKLLDLFDQHKTMIDTEKSFKCDKCGFKYCNADALKRHMQRHVPKKSILYSCTHCDFHTYFKNNLKVHLVCKHTTDKPLSCTLCSFKCADASNLNRHKWTVHHNRKRIKKGFPCNFCTFVTDCTNKLIIHEKSKHNKLFTGRCDLCAFKTDTNLKLKAHERSKHPKEEPFSCQYCGKTFALRKTKNEHELNMHSKRYEFECEHCDYLSNSTKYFKRHVVEKHVKPFQCNTCGFRCGRNSGLKDHMKIHSRKNTFACERCDYTTNIAQYLSSHVRRKHK